MDNKYIIAAIILGAIIIGGGIAYSQLSECDTGGKVVAKEEVSEKALNYINKNLLRGMATASIKEILEENGLYKIDIDIQGQQISTYVTKDGELFFPEGIKLNEAVLAATSRGQTIGGFNISEDEICLENGKPLVYFFGSESCPHCSWEHPVVQEVAVKFGDNISLHDNMESDADQDVFQKYSTGGVPTLVLGCKYYRVGSGEQSGREAEIENLTALFCKLTDNNPAEACDAVKDKINQIN